VRRAQALLVAGLVVVSAAPAFAQAVAPSTSARVLLDVGALIVGSADAGSSTITYLAPDGTAIPQFSIEKTAARAFGVSGHVQVRLTPRVALEVTGEWARPELRTRLTGDAEADEATATQSIHRFVLGGGVVADVKQLGKWHTFARGSFGWLRELSDDQTLYQDGWVAQMGGGARYQWTAKNGHFRPYGIRTDIWLDVRHGGVAFSDKARLWAPAFSAAVIFKL
jgi:hypothetical protein